MVKVGLAAGDKSYDTVRRALDLISDDIHIPDNLPVSIKPNMVSDQVELSATPVQAIRGTLDFLTELGVKKFIIGEGSSKHGDTMSAFSSYGYLPLKDNYNVEFRDLGQDDYITFEVLGSNLSWVTVRLAKSCFNSYIVSVTRMKTHMRVGVTLTIKNMAIGSILDPDRQPTRGGLVSHDPKDLNLSIARLAKVVFPHLAIIDGVVGMEGNGPVQGTPISSGVAVAGTDALAVDEVGAQLMGFDPRIIGYMWYLSNIRNLSAEDIEVLGEDVVHCTKKFKAHERFQEMLGWWVEDWRKYVDKS
ncbi:DUF362 domain-containing protein [Chloroflexota bacterium]